jgi:hypothetical protein
LLLECIRAAQSAGLTDKLPLSHAWHDRYMTADTVTRQSGVHESSEGAAAA